MEFYWLVGPVTCSIVFAVRVIRGWGVENPISLDMNTRVMSFFGGCYQGFTEVMQD